MFQSSCDHHQGVFLKTCFLKEVAKIYYLFLMWRHVCVCLYAFCYFIYIYIYLYPRWLFARFGPVTVNSCGVV